MSIKEMLYTKIVGWLNVVTGYFNTQLCGYYLKKNEEHADTFLKEFRSFREDPTNFSAQEKAKPRKNCTHLKGSRRSQIFCKDYNLAAHRFVDGRTKIWCLNNCGFQVWNDQDGFKEAIALMEQSTNTPTSSEHVVWAITRKGQDTVYVDKDPTVTCQDKRGD